MLEFQRSLTKEELEKASQVSYFGSSYNKDRKLLRKQTKTKKKIKKESETYGLKKKP